MPCQIGTTDTISAYMAMIRPHELLMTTIAPQLVGRPTNDICGRGAQAIEDHCGGLTEPLYQNEFIIRPEA